MNRRTLLRQIGGAGAVASLAGCVADRPDTDEENPDSDDEDPNSDADEPAATDGNESDGENESDNDSVDDTGTSSPELTGTDVATHSAQCGSGGDGSSDQATISFGDGSVAVEGTITAPDPCHEAEVSAAEYSQSADELSITVGTAPADSDQLCADCIADVEYTATASFDGGTPISAAVNHETPGDGTKTVAEKSRH